MDYLFHPVGYGLNLSRPISTRALRSSAAALVSGCSPARRSSRASIADGGPTCNAAIRAYGLALCRRNRSLRATPLASVHRVFLD
jgi:hypothetical protein